MSGSILGGSRTGPSGSVDDTYIANIIWDSPSHPSHEALHPPPLQKSPLHKSTSALSDLKDVGAATTATPSSSSANYKGQPRLNPGNSRSHGTDYHNTSTPSSSYRTADDLNVSGVSSRNQGMGLREIDLTNEIFQHFSRTRKEVTPPPTAAVPNYLSPRQNAQFSVPRTSSPIRRTSSPDVLRGDQRNRSSSPDVFLPTPEHHYQQQPVSHSHSNSYNPVSPGRNAYSNPPSRSNSKPNFKSGTTGANPQSVPNPYQYDSMGTGYHNQPPHAHRHQSHSDISPYREEGGAYRQGQQPPRSTGMSLPRQHEESLETFLHDLQESKTNPFSGEGGGTLV